MANVRVLKSIAAGLEEIDCALAWNVTAGVGDNGEDEEIVNTQDGGTPYEEPFYTPGFDREEVEIAIDAFLSHLLEQKLIRKKKLGGLPSFVDVFEMFFGANHKIAKVAERFEEHVTGYFGWINSDEMSEAYADFLEIQNFIQQELETWGVENK